MDYFDEEERMLHVAVTRPKDKLVLLHYETWRSQRMEISPFLKKLFPLARQLSQDRAYQ